MPGSGALPGGASGQSMQRIPERTDVIVLGAGIVGTAVALHLRARGRSVLLADRRAPGEETSHGNAGVVEGSALLPVGFPYDARLLLDVALKRATVANYHFAALPALLPWLRSYARASTPARLAASARLLRPLLAVAVAEHRALAARAGAGSLYRDSGWITLYRRTASVREAEAELALAREFGLAFDWLTPSRLGELEPHLRPVWLAGIHWAGSDSVSDPGTLVKALAARFEAEGGRVVRADAATLAREGDAWHIETGAGRSAAPEVVLALGPWSRELLERLGLSVPLAVKRGYHLHYRAAGAARLSRPICDKDAGFCLAPMQRGLRLTSGVEFARRDAPATPVQLERLEPIVRDCFPLGERVDAAPWLGARPCLPDSLPVIGPVPRRRGLWLAFGHQHWGFTLGPATGRLVAEMMCGETPFCDPAPFALARFAS